MSEIEERRRFERWVSSPPIVASTERLGKDSAWPGQYGDYEVQLAWEAWLERSKHGRPKGGKK